MSRGWWVGLGLVLVDTVFTSAAQVCFKTGAAHLETLSLAALGEPWIVAGLVLQVAMLPVALGAYRLGDVVVFYPLMSLSHVWNVGVGALWLGEEVTSLRLAATALIVAGAAVLAWPRAPREPT